MPDVPVLGGDCKAYYNTGTNAIPVWVLIADAVEVTATGELGKGTLATRSSPNNKSVAGKFTEGFTFKYTFAAEATVFDALRAAWRAGTIQQYAIMDGLVATSDQQGLRLYGLITKFDYDQPLEEMSNVDFSVEHAYFVESAAVIESNWFVVA